ncbi:hypothetical protein KIK84_03775 [Curvibacter sp. CHRR-16]|nr:hypothetical protein [Curvibacter sp. CHRR-16]
MHRAVQHWAALLGIGACLLATSAQAMSLREWRTLGQVPDQGDLYATYYLVGLMEGIVEDQADISRRGEQPRICPNGRKLEPSMARNLFNAELLRNEGLYEADMPVELIMRNALEASYPC